MSELVKLSAAEMAAKIKAKEVSSRELVEAHLESSSRRAEHQAS